VKDLAESLVKSLREKLRFTQHDKHVWTTTILLPKEKAAGIPVAFLFYGCDEM
jgi:hypothetical protein